MTPKLEGAEIYCAQIDALEAYLVCICFMRAIERLKVISDISSLNLSFSIRRSRG